MRPVDFKSQHWLKLRAAVLSRDRWRCVVCAKTDGLTVHHITPRRQGGRSELRNLISLCIACHDKAEEQGWSWIQAERYKAKNSMKFNDKEPQGVVLLPGEHLARSKDDGKWRIWGRDGLGIYSVIVSEGASVEDEIMAENS